MNLQASLPKNRAIVVVTDSNPVDAQRIDGKYVNCLPCDITHGCLKQQAFIPVDFLLGTEIITSDGSRVVFNSVEQALQELKGVHLRYRIGRSSRGNLYRFFSLMA